jgi:D-alanyl-D-alanine carboxypeptidase
MALEEAMAARLQTLAPVGVLGAVLVMDAPQLGRVGAAMGYADLSGKAITRADAFQIGSQTKVFTAAAIVRLARHGQIDLDDYVAQYVDGVVGGDTVTLHQLLNHTSGLGDGVRHFDTPGPPPQRHVSFEELARLSAQDGPAFAPGEGWAYNNFGFDILGKVMARVTDTSAAAYVAQAFLTPLGLDHTMAASKDHWPMPLAHGYHAIDGIPADMGAPHDLAWAYTAGDMISTSDDMIDWIRALAAEDATLGVALRDLRAGFVAVPDDPDMPRYGYGLMERRFGAVTTWGHGGFIHGYISYAGVAPGQDVAFSIMTSLNGDPALDYGAVIDRLSLVLSEALAAMAEAARTSGRLSCGD